jgi:hypothetical protein
MPLDPIAPTVTAPGRLPAPPVRRIAGGAA